MKLKPFFSYYGGKFRFGPRYPAPEFPLIVEPFAGSAGYSVRHFRRRVLLCDAYEPIAAIWRYLIEVPAERILSLPLIEPGQTVDDLAGLSDVERWLIGFRVNSGAAAPCNRPSKWMRDKPMGGEFWNTASRRRIAEQVGAIRHWDAVHGDYRDLPDVEATWFIDPPYQNAGKHYKHGSAGFDFDELGEWCRSRRGQVIVCENDGADWLPFRPFMRAKATAGRCRAGASNEAIWTNRPIGLFA